MSDRRRLLGSVNTIIPNVGLSSADGTAQPAKIESKTEPRIDGLRPFFLKTGIIENANGSSYLEVGNNIIEVSVYGPRPIRGSFIDRASFSVECKFLPFISQPNEHLYNNTSISASSAANTTNQTNVNVNGRTGLTSIEHKISSYIETSLLPSIVLEKYPKSTIDVFVTIISTDSSLGGSYSDTKMLSLVNWVLNASSVALVDSGIEVKDVVTSGVAHLQNDVLVLDPTEIQEKDEGSVSCVASFMNLRNDEIVGIWIEGDQTNLENSQVDHLLDGCNDMSKKVRANINSYFTTS
ncbi:hypothetical protein G9P44_003094 [Scheffersomyces stipitis]|nr:hypothetical protein G9P44_003094 [Scheffersomyces stipitis]